MRPQVIFILSIALSLCTTVVSFGQSLSDTNGPPPPKGGTLNGPQFPIDDNIYILLAMGLLLGVYFLIKKYRSNDSLA